MQPCRVMLEMFDNYVKMSPQQSSTQGAIGPLVKLYKKHAAASMHTLNTGRLKHMHTPKAVFKDINGKEFYEEEIEAGMPSSLAFLHAMVGFAAAARTELKADAQHLLKWCIEMLHAREYVKAVEHAMLALLQGVDSGGLRSIDEAIATWGTHLMDKCHRTIRPPVKSGKDSPDGAGIGGQEPGSKQTPPLYMRFAKGEEGKAFC